MSFGRGAMERSGTATDDGPRGRGRGRPPRTESERATQRARLLETAMVAIRQHGGDVSIDEIAAEAGVSKPVFYSEFGGKAGIAEALAVALAERAEGQLIAKLAAAGTIDTEAGLRFAIETLMSLVTDEPQVYGFLVRCVRENDQGLLDNALVRTLHSRVLWLIKTLAPDRDPALLSVLTHGMFGFVFASVESWHTSGAPPREALIDALVGVATNGFDAVGGTTSARKD